MKKMLVMMLCIIVITTYLAGCSNESNNIFSNKILSFDKDKINSDVIQGSSQFAFDIFKQLNGEDKNKNIFISPLSISTALSMTYQGAEGTTKDAMAKALNYEDVDMEVLNGNYKNLLRYLKQATKKTKLDINNSIWIRKGEVINENFLNINREVFDAYVSEIDFSEKDSVDKINNWIDNATNGKIQKMIESPISPEILMYLINAVYFKGEWTEKFDKKHTFKTKFYIEEGKTKDVMMMNRKGEVEYGKGDNFKVAKLPYGDGNISMYCMLPDEGISIDDFIESMDLDTWQTIKENVYKTEDVVLQIPRFNIEYGIKNLNDSLSMLGMEEAFSYRADFSGIRDGIFISRVLHKAVIEVNEEGSEAAAATVVEMKESAMAEPIEFIANRPFMFIIADDEYGTILFMGKVYNVN